MTKKGKSNQSDILMKLRKNDIRIMIILTFGVSPIQDGSHG